MKNKYKKQLALIEAREAFSKGQTLSAQSYEGNTFLQKFQAQQLEYINSLETSLNKLNEAIEEFTEHIPEHEYYTEYMHVEAQLIEKFIDTALYNHKNTKNSYKRRICKKQLSYLDYVKKHQKKENKENVKPKL